MQDYDPFSAVRAGSSSADRCLVIGQLGQSLDGRVATLSGESKYISGPWALDHLHRLRAAADAVVVGIGTVLADDPLLNVRRVPGRNPARVIIDPSGRLNNSARCLGDDGARRIVLRRADASGPLPRGVEAMAVAADGEGRLPPGSILAVLRAAGLRRVLVEGGPATLASFLDAKAIDRLHILISPVILGSGRTGLDLRPIGDLKDALRPASRVTVFPDGDVLFDCNMRDAAQEEYGHGERSDHSLFAPG